MFMKKRLICVLILIAYCAGLVKVMVFKEVPMVRVDGVMIYFGGSQTGPANLVPFKTIWAYLHGEKGLMIGSINLIGNIILLLPVGLLIPLVFRGMTSKKMVLPGAFAGFAIEGLQLVLRLGIFDIDDVILNGLGVMVGYWVFTFLNGKLHSMTSKHIRIAVMVLMVIATVTASFGLTVYWKGQFPLSFEKAPVKNQSTLADQGTAGIGGGDDPCGGTGGLGQIVGTGNHAITIQRSDGLREMFKLTAQTIIRNSAGTMVESGLKIGNRVTIVTFESDRDGNKIATAVLICNVLSPGI